MSASSVVTCEVCSRCRQLHSCCTCEHPVLTQVLMPAATHRCLTLLRMDGLCAALEWTDPTEDHLLHRRRQEQCSWRRWCGEREQKKKPPPAANHQQLDTVDAGVFSFG
ncbi:unnamed protein product [Effrenium voratum]|uniref:Uncharacterized protein n=1 Tax=Effrenium voratum TaxID=2562239 RepID=A0AA36J6M5_9DINO|nr:unnamed protein product [Effrenium voratum]CAJ1439736.1 unnamed protein product [Effrenium voratum]